LDTGKKAVGGSYHGVRGIANSISRLKIHIPVKRRNILDSFCEGRKRRDQKKYQNVKGRETNLTGQS